MPMTLPSVLSAPPAATMSSVHRGTGWASTLTHVAGSRGASRANTPVKGARRRIASGELNTEVPDLAQSVAINRGAAPVVVEHRS